VVSWACKNGRPLPTKIGTVGRFRRSAASFAGSVGGVGGIANDAQNRSQDSLIQIKF